MRVIVACRLSKFRDGSTGLDTQESEAVRWAEAEGHEVEEVVRDAVSGAKTILSRTRLRPWLTEPEKLARYDAIVVYRMDRLTRGDSAETRRIETWADDNAKTLMTADGLVFPCEGADGIRWDLAKRLAHDEWLKISERYGRMKADVKSRGGYIGKVPFGMILQPNAQGAKALAHGSQWHLVEEAFKRASKQRLGVLGLWLQEQTGEKWYERRVLRLLRNPVYGSVEGFERVQAVLDARGLMGRGADRDGEKALLSRLKCGNPECDATGLDRGPSPMNRINSRGFLYYRCMGRPEGAIKRQGCGQMIRVETLDALVLGGLEIWWTEPYLERLFIPGDDMSVRIEELRARLPHARDRKEVNDLYDQIEALEAEGSTRARWETRDSGMSVGEFLASATLAEQRTFFADRDIRAWHKKSQILVTVDGKLARAGGRSAVGDMLAEGS
jgi:DNA invertase Pin-like site-specific DNA recombinase